MHLPLKKCVTPDLMAWKELQSPWRERGEHLYTLTSEGGILLLQTDEKGSEKKFSSQQLQEKNATFCARTLLYVFLNGGEE